MGQFAGLHDVPSPHNRTNKALAQSALDGLGDKVLNSDSRLSNSREWTAATVSQAIAEAGVDTTRTAWTAQRVFQAVAAWWNGSAHKTKLDGIQAGAQVNLPVGTTTGTVAAGDDSRLSNSREWTAATVAQATAEAGTDTTRTAWTAQRVRQAVTAWWGTITDVVKTSGAQSISGVKSFISRSSHTGAYTPSLFPAHSATPTFDAAASNVFEPDTMTTDISSVTIANPASGQTVQIRFQQDGSGRAITLGGAFRINGTYTVGAWKLHWLVVTYSGRSGQWEGSWLVLP